MHSIMRRVGVAAMAGLALAAVPAQAQSPYFQVAPGLTLQQYAYNLATIGRAYSSVPPYAPAYNAYLRTGAALSPYAAASPFVNPYAAAGLAANQVAAASLATNPYLTAGLGAYNPYGYPYYYQDPYNGYLTGAAAVISSQGQFMMNKQQAALMYEQVRQARIDTRRKAFDEFLYEREKTPSLEEERERLRILERDRSRNNPPETEIFSAKALNDLLRDIQTLQSKGTLSTFRAPQVPLDEDDLRRINVTSAKTGGNIGLLKNDGRVTWPVALSGAEFREERERLGTLAQEAVKAAAFNNPVDAGTLRTLSGDLERLNQKLVKNVGDLPPAQYIEAKRFLAHFADAVKALQQPDAGSYFTKKLKGKTVSELVDHMTKSGLWFAPAVPGDEAAYLALHRALAAYDLALLAHTGGDAAARPAPAPQPER